MIDFDKMYEKYVKVWLKENLNKFQNEEEVENVLSDVYINWLNSPQNELNGLSVKEFFDLKNAEALIKMLIESSTGKSEPPMPLIEKISKSKDCTEGLIGIIRGKYSAKQKFYAVNLLSQIGAKPPVEIYIDWISNPKTDFDLTELVIEELYDYADDAAQLIYPKLPNADFETKICYAEILSCAKKDERTYELLIELFNTKKDIPLTANFLGEYGDERAADALYKALKTCNYYEYCEIKNAVERLGGIVEDDRDFSSDPYYKTIKNSI